MRRLHLAVAATAGLIASAGSTADGQTCRGTAAYVPSRIKVAGALHFADGLESFAAGLGVGGSRTFATGEVVRYVFDGSNVGVTTYGAETGVEFRVDSLSSPRVCPLIAFTYQPANDFFVSATSIAFGGSAGWAFAPDPDIQLVPVAAAMREWDRAAGETATYTTMQLGAGLVLGREWTIQPSMTFTPGIEGSTPSYAISFTYNFGSSPSRHEADR